MSDKAINTLLDARHCCSSWERKACIIGNVQAGDLADAIDDRLSEIERLRARVAELEGREARLRKAAGAYRQCEMDYVFLAERPDEEYIAADVHQARMHMHMAATKLDAALAETAP